MDLPEIIRDAIAEEVESTPTIGDTPDRGSIEVVYLDRPGDPNRVDIDTILSVRIIKFTADAPNEKNPRGCPFSILVRTGSDPSLEPVNFTYQAASCHS